MLGTDDAVTPGEVWRKLEAIHGDLRRVLDDHEVRLRKLERWMYAIPPTLVMAAASIVAAVLKA